MRASIVVLAVGAILVPFVAAPEAAAEVESYGEELSADVEPTPIEEILSDPDRWAGRRVRIEGEVSGVCAHQGCWIDLRSPEDATLRVKVEDGVIVFPQDAVGKPAVAEGEVEILEMERDKYEAWLRHVAEEEARAFDPAEVGEGPYRIVRLRGIGASVGRP